MNKKTVWVIIGIIVVFAIILIATTGDKSSQQNQPSTTLPEVSQAEYNTLQTSNDDFSALDEALNQLG